ncbi:MAG: S-layer homology domain-containing protein [Clostridia bacterium]|nr:S-layer homology domain-containing protein [Clostridia bacterium]
MFKPMKLLAITSLLLLVSTFAFTAFCEDYSWEDHHESTSESDTTISSGSQGNSNPDSSHDAEITSKINQIDGTLLDVIADIREEDGLLSDNMDGLTTLVTQIKTPSGAKSVLAAMPETLDELLVLKNQMTSPEEKIRLETDIAELMVATEQLIELIDQSEPGIELLSGLFESLGPHYQDMDVKSITTKNMMNSAITMSNSVIKKAGTVELNWSGIEISDGRVFLTPDETTIQSAVSKAAETEALFETLLSTHIDQGLEEAVVSTFTLKVPQSLETAAKTGVVITESTFKTLKNHDIEHMNVDLGAANFGLSDKFIAEHEATDFEFHVSKDKALETGMDALPSDLSSVGAPVLDLSAKQNDNLNHAFNHPVQLTLELDYFDYEPKDQESLLIGRFNENTGIWEPVGGKYDPTTNTITVYRMHLSKYTVLKSEKSYSHIEDSWAKDQIASLTNKGIITNTEDFIASDDVTREEFAGWIAKAYGLDSATLESNFNDLNPDSPYYEAVKAAYEQGIISGGADDQFHPDSAITKEEMAVMITAAMKKYDYAVNTDSFELAAYENDLPEWALQSVEHVVENGIVDESYFASTGTVTKEEAAAILYQVYR